MIINFRPLSFLLAFLLFLIPVSAKADINTGPFPETLNIEKGKPWVYKLPKKRASLEFSIKLKQNDNFQITFSNNKNFSSEILRIIISDTDCNAEHKLFATYTQPKHKNTNLFKYMDSKVPWNQDQHIEINWTEGNKFTIKRNNESFSLDLFKLPKFVKFYSHKSEIVLNTNKITFTN